MPDLTHNCRPCGKVSPHDGKICLGCGTPIANAKAAKAPAGPKRVCPKCKSGSYRVLEEGRFVCRGCAAVYEELDGFAWDDRPDVNAEKRERASERLWKGGRR